MNTETYLKNMHENFVCEGDRRYYLSRSLPKGITEAVLVGIPKIGSFIQKRRETAMAV